MKLAKVEVLLTLVGVVCRRDRRKRHPEPQLRVRPILPSGRMDDPPNNNITFAIRQCAA